MENEGNTDGRGPVWTWMVVSAGVIYGRQSHRHPQEASGEMCRVPVMRRDIPSGRLRSRVRQMAVLALGAY